MKDYNRNNTLYSRLLDAATDGKLPILDNKSFELLNKTYGKEKMRTHIADYIASERPVSVSYTHLTLPTRDDV